MARIAGINIPDRKHAWVSLTSIYGIGRTRARAICADAGISPDVLVKDLTEEELDSVRGQVGRY
jgi:small subunit ribosomal protein S13